MAVLYEVCFRRSKSWAFRTLPPQRHEPVARSGEEMAYSGAGNPAFWPCFPPLPGDKENIRHMLAIMQIHLV